MEMLNPSNDQRKLASGFALSVFVHLGLLIILSLLVVGSKAKSSMVTLWSESNNESINNPVLISETLPSPQEIIPDIDNASPSLELDSVTIPSIAPLAQATSVSVAREVPIANAESAATSVDLSLTRSIEARSIQSRVEEAGGKKGEVQFALSWKNLNDLDLHVIAPSGEHISHQHRRSQCTGMLDVDMNVRGESQEPVENIRWISRAPWGRYTILVNLFKIHSDGMQRPRFRTDYKLLAKLGNEMDVREATASPGERQVTVWRFHYVSSSVSPQERERLLNKLTQLQEREESLAGEMLEEAKKSSNDKFERRLQAIVQTYPHTDAAIEALQLMSNKVVK